MLVNVDDALETFVVALIKKLFNPTVLVTTYILLMSVIPLALVPLTALSITLSPILTPLLTRLTPITLLPLVNEKGRLDAVTLTLLTIGVESNCVSP